jgi:hypothetical protein
MAVDPGEAAPMVVGLDQLLDAKLSIPQRRPGSVSLAKLIEAARASACRMVGLTAPGLREVHLAGAVGPRRGSSPRMGHSGPL